MNLRSLEEKLENVIAKREAALATMNRLVKNKNFNPEGVGITAFIALNREASLASDEYSKYTNILYRIEEILSEE